MKRIVFEGYLKDMYPDGIEVEGNSAAECITALGQFPGFRESDGVRHTVALPEFGSRDALFSRTDKDRIVVVPVLAGAGGKAGSLLLVVIGVILIATGWGAGLGVEVLGVSISAGTLTSIGVTLVLNGVLGLLAPAPPSFSPDAAEEKSNYLPGNKNTTRIGTRIPLLFGRRRIWGHILSFNITAGNKPAPDIMSDPPAGGSAYIADSNYDYSTHGA